MSGPHNESNEQQGGTNPVTLAIVVAVGAVALVIGIILMTQVAVGMYGSRSLKDDPSMSPEAVAKRLAPVAKVEIDPNAPAAAPATTATPATAAPVAAPAIPPAATKTADAGAGGKATYDSTCMACHATGAAGAPKFGDKAAWAPRIKTGMDALHASALKGKGAMPAKGGNASLSDDAVKAAVDYMVGAAK